MARRWQLHEAKNQLSQVVAAAEQGGAQIMTRRGEGVAVVLSFAGYLRLRRPEQDLVAFFRASPLVSEDLALARDRSGAHSASEQ